MLLSIGACAPAQPPQTTGVDCARYGGCDVLEDLADGTAKIIPLQTMTYFTADLRARQDAQLSGVLDTAVVGHNPPHNPISRLYHSGQNE